MPPPPSSSTSTARSIDTAPDLVDTLNVIFRTRRLCAVALRDAREFCRRRRSGDDRARLRCRRSVLATTKLERLFEDFIAHYSEHLADRSLPFPGLTEALDTSRRRGCRFAVCTNKLEVLSVRLLEASRPRRPLRAICGQDTFGMQKPGPGDTAPHDSCGRRKTGDHAS